MLQLFIHHHLSSLSVPTVPPYPWHAWPQHPKPPVDHEVVRPGWGNTFSCVAGCLLSKLLALCIQGMVDFPGKLVRINLQRPNKNYALYRLFIFFWGSLSPGSVTVKTGEPHCFVSLPKCIVSPWIYEPLTVQL